MNNSLIYLGLKRAYKRWRKVSRAYSSYLYRTKARFRVAFRRDQILAYWWDGWPNFGDRFTPYLLEKKYGLKSVNARGCGKDFGPAIVGSGSILNGLKYPNNVIWGAGFINAGSVKSGKPRVVLAYRGPDSGGLAASHGWPRAQVYGDPGLLASKYIPASPKKYKVGIVPHYVHKKILAEGAWGEPVLMIDVESNLEETVKQISSCERIISSSLHGLIVAHSYGIPWIWMKLSTPLRKRGDVDFKFNDFMKSVGVTTQPFYVENASELKRVIDALEEKYVIPDLERTLMLQDQLDRVLDCYMAERLQKPMPERRKLP